MMALLLLLAGLATASEQPEETDRGSTEAISEHREAPNYDGREPRKVTVGEALLVVPRLILLPAWAAERYLLYPPIRSGVLWAEENRIPVKISNLLSFGKEYRFQVVPSALIDFGFRPSIGLSLQGKNLTKGEHHGRIKGAWGGNGWMMFTGTYHVPLSTAARESNQPLSGSMITVDGWYIDRPDMIFHGLGTSATSERTRFRERTAGGQMDLELAFGELDGVVLSGGANDHAFGPGRSYQGDALLEERFEPASLTGFVDGYTLAWGETTVALDTRKRLPGKANGLPASGTGARIEAGALLGSDISGDSGELMRWSGEGAVFFDLNGRNRTLGIRQFAAGVRPLGEGTIPFSELVTLGGTEVLRGHLSGRLRGASALATGLQYTWPIWVMLDGSIEAEVGGAFGPDFENVAVEDMVASFAVGVRSPKDRDAHTQLTFGFGTAPFSQGGKVDSFRFVLGSSEGF
jgi:hypothetical protein